MAKDKVITVMCAARLPEMLVKRMDAAAASGGVSRAQFIAEACRTMLDGLGRPLAESFDKYPARSFAIPNPSVDPESNINSTKDAFLGNPTMQDLRDICAGKSVIIEIRDGHVEEVKLCHKRWWEDGTHYECIMDTGHREQKHGLRGMVRRIDE